MALDRQGESLSREDEDGLSEEFQVQFLPSGRNGHSDTPVL